ncbi:MAG TPA: elongation factor G, partial [Deltaproteobacteria bacterium]|nr:elongation factor G [Deltaproteobacteria bacterium]
KKQTGGAGQFGEVYLKIEPLERGTGFQFESKVVGGVIPSQFIPAVEKGVRQVLAEGTVAGYPLQDIKVTVYDGKHHPVDSKEVAFVSAARRAFQEAIMAAGPVVLEPIVSVAVTAPDEHIGDITGGLASKRGQIKGTSIAPNNCMTVESNLPLSELTNYTAELKSMTSGQGSYIMDFSHYEPMPRDSQEKLVAAYKKADDD